MSQLFDYNGVAVAPSVPKRVLRTQKKTLHIDSADREQVKYYTNGEFVVYLPRTFSNVVSIRLKAAEFPPILAGGSNPAARQHTYSTAGGNVPTSTYTNDVAVTTDNYFLIDIDGLNKSDECSVNGVRSTYPDHFFAKIPAVIQSRGNAGALTNMIAYNDNSFQENIALYSPPLESLDKLRIRIRLHSQQGNQGFMYWTSDGAVAGAGNRGGAADFNLCFEFEYLTNGFDDYSSFETRVPR